MLIPEIDDVEPALNQAEQDVVDSLYQLLDAAAIGYEKRHDDGTILHVMGLAQCRVCGLV